MKDDKEKLKNSFDLLNEFNIQNGNPISKQVIQLIVDMNELLHSYSRDIEFIELLQYVYEILASIGYVKITPKKVAIIVLTNLFNKSLEDPIL